MPKGRGFTAHLVNVREGARDVPVEVRELDIDEVLRYMGCPPERAEASVRVLAERAVEIGRASCRERV